MGIKYTKDEDLAFLEYCSEEDIEQLAKILIYDGKGNERLTSQIMSDENFKKLNGSPDQWRKSWKLVAGELQHFGGDTIVNLFRQKGVPYRRILKDTCKKQGVGFENKKPTWEIEKELIEDFVKNILEKMTEEERDEVLKSMNFREFTGKKFDWRNMSSTPFWGGAAAGAWYAWAASVSMAAFAPAVISRVGIAGVSMFVAQRGAASLVNPIVGVALTVPAVSGTAYRVTVPATIQIAYMRQKYLNKDRFE